MIVAVGWGNAGLTAAERVEDTPESHFPGLRMICRKKRSVVHSPSSQEPLVPDPSAVKNKAWWERHLRHVLGCVSFPNMLQRTFTRTPYLFPALP